MKTPGLINFIFQTLTITVLSWSHSYLVAAQSCEDSFKASQIQEIVPVQALSFSPLNQSNLPVSSELNPESPMTESLLKKIYTFMSHESEDFTANFSASEFKTPSWHKGLLKSRVLQALLGENSWAILQNFQALTTDAQIKIATQVSLTLFELLDDPNSGLSEGMIKQKMNPGDIKNFSHWWSKAANWDPQINILYVLSHFQDLSQDFYENKLASRWFKRMMLQRRMRLTKMTTETRKNIEQHFESIENNDQAHHDPHHSSKWTMWILHSIDPKKYRNPKEYGKEFTPRRYSTIKYSGYKEPVQETPQVVSKNPELQAKISAYEDELLEVTRELDVLLSADQTHQTITMESLKEELNFYTYLSIRKDREYDKMEGSILKLKNFFERLKLSRIGNDERRLLLSFVLEKMSVISHYNSRKAPHKYKWYGSVANHRDLYHAMLIFYDHVHLFNISDESTLNYVEDEVRSLIDYAPPMLPDDIVENSMADKNGLELKLEAFNNLQGLRDLDWKMAIKPKSAPPSQKMRQRQLVDSKRELQEELDRLYLQRDGQNQNKILSFMGARDVFPYSYDPMFIFLNNWTNTSGYLNFLDSHSTISPTDISFLPSSKLSHQFLESYTSDLLQALAFLSRELATIKSQSSVDQINLIEDQKNLTEALKKSTIRLEIDQFDRTVLLDFADQIRDLNNQIKELLEQAQARRNLLESRKTDFFDSSDDSPLRGHYDQTLHQLEMVKDEAEKLSEIASQSSGSILQFLRF